MYPQKRLYDFVLMGQITDLYLVHKKKLSFKDNYIQK